MRPKRFKLLFAIALLALAFSGCRGFSLDLSGKAAQTEADGRKNISDAKADAINTDTKLKAMATPTAVAQEHTEWVEEAPVRDRKNKSLATLWGAVPVWLIPSMAVAVCGTALVYLYFIKRRAQLQSAVIKIPRDQPSVTVLPNQRLLVLDPSPKTGLHSGEVVCLITGEVTPIGNANDVANVAINQALAPPKPNMLVQLVSAAMANRGLAPPTEVPLIEDKSRGE